INSDGSLAGLRIVKSSGHIELDNAVRRIIEMSAPFSAFPPDMKRSFDVADITRTWVFVGDRPRINAQ
ncbi:MAG: TonB family protein, partial [Rhodocyclaceae bacterium]|nr:TonB family protein [Rhodocyclaceae bacterium]